MFNANLLLGLVAAVAVTTTLLSCLALMWVTRTSPEPARSHPAGDHLQAAEGGGRGAGGEPPQLLPARLPHLSAPLLRGRRRRPGHRGRRAAPARVPRAGRPAGRGLPGVRPQPEGGEPGGDGPLPEARRHPDQRLQRPRPARRTSARRPATSPSRASAWSATSSWGSERPRPARSWRTSSSTASSPGAWRWPRSFRVTCVVGKSMLMPVRALEAIGGFASVRNLLAEDQVIGVRIRKAGYSIRLSHHVIENVNQARGFTWFLNRHSRWYKIRRQLALPAFLIEPIGEPRDDRAGLGPLGRVGDRLGRAGAPGRAGDGPRRVPDALAPRLVPQAAPPGAQPGEGPAPAARLVRRPGQQAHPVARPPLPGRPIHPAPPGPAPRDVRRRVRRVHRLRTRHEH